MAGQQPGEEPAAGEAAHRHGQGRHQAAGAVQHISSDKAAAAHAAQAAGAACRCKLAGACCTPAGWFCYCDARASKLRHTAGSWSAFRAKSRFIALATAERYRSDDDECGNAARRPRLECSGPCCGPDPSQAVRTSQLSVPCSDSSCEAALSQTIEAAAAAMPRGCHHWHEIHSARCSGEHVWDCLHHR